MRVGWKENGQEGLGKSWEQAQHNRARVRFMPKIEYLVKAVGGSGEVLHKCDQPPHPIHYWCFQDICLERVVHFDYWILSEESRMDIDCFTKGFGVHLYSRK